MPEVQRLDPDGGTYAITVRPEDIIQLAGPSLPHAAIAP